MESSSREALKRMNAELLSMVDSAMEVVALFGFRSESPSQKRWAEMWLQRARAYGCSLE